MSPKNWRRFLEIYQNSGINGLRERAEKYISLGKRRRLVSLCQFVISQKINDPILLRCGINSLLVLGLEEKAKALLTGCRDGLASAPSYISMLDRYLERHSIFPGLEESLQELKSRLLHEFASSKSSASFVGELSSFTAIILVSNGPSLEFSSEDKGCMLAMTRPLFV